jgi:hypothetical protein
MPSYVITEAAWARASEALRHERDHELTGARASQGEGEACLDLVKNGRRSVSEGSSILP